MTNPQDSEQVGWDNRALADDEMDGWGRREPIEEDAIPMDIANPNFLDHHTEIVPIDHVPPRMDGVPLNELHLTYSKTDARIKTTDFITVFDNGNVQPNLLFTAIFTCPIDGEHFASGDWGESTNVVRMGDVYWFKNKKQARSAAAARTLDVMSVRRCHGINRRPFQRCRDEPYHLIEEAPALPVLPSGIQLPSVKTNANEWDSSPKAALSEWYQSFQRRLKQMGGTLTMNTPDESTYATWNNHLEDSNRRFTSVFTCPITGERFASGALADRQYDKDHMYYFSDLKELKFNMMFDENVENNSTIHKLDLIWYKNKKNAEDAAAARAVDCLRFRYSTSHCSGKKYCMEEPYTTESTPELWKNVSKSVTQVFQFETTKDGEIVAKPEVWPTLLSASKIPEDVLKSVFDQDLDELLRAYKHQRTMPPDEMAVEEEEEEN